MTGALAEAAPAKINLCLHVTGRRDDGYHLLSTLVAFADVCDTLHYEPSDAFSLVLDGPEAGALSGEADNLVLRAGRRLADAAGILPSGRLTLIKRLPVASGIGGGSADAAAALRLLSRAWHLDGSAGDLPSIAASLGADVPMCLSSGPAVASGIGDILDPVAALPPLHMLLVNPRRPVATPPVFRARTGPFSSEIGPVPTESFDAFLGWLSARRNDLQDPAMTLEPAIRAVLDILAAQPGCRLARMSGSGATCFALFDDAEITAVAASRVGQAFPGWWVRPARTSMEVAPPPG